MSNKLPEINFQEWFNAAFIKVVQRPEGSFIVDDVIKATGLSKNGAIDKINRLIERGEVIKGGKFLDGSTWKNYYLPALIATANGNQKNIIPGSKKKASVGSSKKTKKVQSSK